MLGKPRPRDLATDLLAWQTVASDYLTTREKVYIAERVEWMRQGMPVDFPFTATPPAPRRE